MLSQKYLSLGAEGVVNVMTENSGAYAYSVKGRGRLLYNTVVGQSREFLR